MTNTELRLELTKNLKWNGLLGVWLIKHHELIGLIERAADALQLERVPMTEEVALKFAHRRATTYTHRSDPHHSGYAFVPHTLMDFVRDLETHHNITPPESKG